MQRLNEGWFSTIRRRFAAFCVVALGVAAVAMAQNKVTIKGKVVDGTGEILPGVSVVVSGTTIGTVTDFDGNYSLSVPVGANVEFSFIGFDNKNITVAAGQTVYDVKMDDSSQELEELVVVGYGQQKKASVVGAITQTTGEVLERAAGISDIGAALTGNLPGVVTTQSSGMPGEEEPKIVIRGQSSPNGSDPLVLVDGIERPMSTVDMNSVQTISVLKDASATAVYGVKGANGVILITTKRGQEGKAQVNVSANAIMKMVSKLPGKLDSYDAYMKRNMAIEHELNIRPGSWANVDSQDFIDMYRNQTTTEQKERYANVDWQDYLFKKRAMSYNANINVGGGTKFVRYFASADFVNEADLFKKFENYRGYETGFGYNKVSVRSNLDFNFTPTTEFKVNIAGSTGITKAGFGGVSNIADWGLSQNWAGAYNIPSNVFLPIYSDGTWGAYLGTWYTGSNVSNSPRNIALGGATKTINTRITTDFILDQDLKFLLEGLKFHGSVSWDNTFESTGFGVNDLYHNPQTKEINPYTGDVALGEKNEMYNGFDYAAGIKWDTDKGSVRDWMTQRNLNYQLQLFYGNQFDKHNVTAMGLFQRQERNTGSNIPSFREDWVFRITYDWASKYFVEYNGAYNGSEKFKKGNRFAFFNSGALGWAISEEAFMQNLKESKIIDFLKLRASYGEIGDDQALGTGDERFKYMTTWAYITGVNNEGKTVMGERNDQSPYNWYKEKSIGNPDVQWEVVRKLNFGLDYSFLDGLVAGSVDVFRDKRTDVFVQANGRAVPGYFGQDAVAANLGEIHNKGYEVEVRLNKTFANGVRVWANVNFTHAENEIIKMDDVPLLPSYRKSEGYSINQTKLLVSDKRMQTYDDIYASPQFETSAYDLDKLPGDHYLIDFNGDGKVTSDDNAPWGYSDVPQNTYNATVGAEFRGWSCFVQLYGVSNVTREVGLTSFGGGLTNVYDTGTWWSENPNDCEKLTPRWNSSLYSSGTENHYDGSYLRLKNAEIAYTWNKLEFGKLALKNVKVFVSGNNLWVWTKMPDDRESNFAGASNQGQYPTVKRINFGLKFSL